MKRIFLDDERDPPDDGNEWIVVRSWAEFKAVLSMDDVLADFISFDHDLGNPYNMDNPKTGFDCAKYLVQMAMSKTSRRYCPLPDSFQWTVHSENPVGRDNINGLLKSYFEFKERMDNE